MTDASERRESRWRETTAQRYAVALDLHVLPSLGGTYLDALPARLIELALTDWAREYQRATVNSLLRILRTVLNGAVALGIRNTDRPSG